VAGCLQVMCGAAAVKGAMSPRQSGIGEVWGGIHPSPLQVGRRWESGKEFDCLGRLGGTRGWREVAVTSYQHCHQCSM